MIRVLLCIKPSTNWDDYDKRDITRMVYTDPWIGFKSKYWVDLKTKRI